MKNNDFKIANFNISGGFYIGNEDTEYLDRKAVDFVDNEFLKQIIYIINSQNIDIICFQEIITTKEVEYIKTIVDNTDLKYYDYFKLSKCNIVKDTDCGLAILSKTPIRCLKKGMFPNPKLSKTTSSGNTYYTYDKGYMVCEVKMGDESIIILTHHGFPYRRFNSTPENNIKVFEFFDNAIDAYRPDIITGDFNADNFMKLMDKTKKNYKRTINDITTVDEKKFDDILVHKNINYSSQMFKLLSDHYMIVDHIKGIRNKKEVKY